MSANIQNDRLSEHINWLSQRSKVRGRSVKGVDYAQSYLKIGQLAKQTGLTVGTLRYYSGLELLPPVYRGENGYRYYHAHAKEQVEFIQKAQKLNSSLKEIKQILAVRDRGEQPCGLVQDF